MKDIEDTEGCKLSFDSYASSTARDAKDDYAFVVIATQPKHRANIIGLTRAHAKELAFYLIEELSK